ncbi:DUF4231 domain-containing protein [Streptacidiphilus neutrinimicus]|uniref:DUF4231 domain-containing protein n=1 Tax=Streptacidiphilus neutrinimicus TaxID=105420 RepID=UPI0005A6601F|nr:DUF4231 domain-containing protein [Streptacidiphilus neutrinimicus]
MVQNSARDIREDGLIPEPYPTIDQVAVNEQQRATRWYGGQILALFAASALGIADWHAGGLDVSPALSLAAFLAAFYYWSRLRARHPQTLWFESRAAAESIKGLVWRYSIRSRPFEGEAHAPDADEQFLDEISEIFEIYRGLGVIGAEEQPSITAEMTHLRGQSLAVRREIYLRERVRSQRVWYTGKADAYDNKSTVWSMATLAAICFGLALALLQISGALHVHALGTFATIGAAITAWTQLKQFRPLAAAYRVAARELEQIENRLARLNPAEPGAEELWSRLAREAESTLAKEQAVWRARSDRRI